MGVLEGYCGGCGGGRGGDGGSNGRSSDLIADLWDVGGEVAKAYFVVGEGVAAVVVVQEGAMVAGKDEVSV